MKLKLVAAISALAISALAHAQQSGAQPKPTKADAQNVVQIITSDKVKTQAYCELDKLEGQVKGAEQKNDTETLAALSNGADRQAPRILQADGRIGARSNAGGAAARLFCSRRRGVVTGLAEGEPYRPLKKLNQVCDPRAVSRTMKQGGYAQRSELPQLVRRT